MTPYQKRKAKKIAEDMELERQVEEILARKRARQPARDSALRGTLTYNSWGHGQHTGQVFRSHCGR